MSDRDSWDVVSLDEMHDFVVRCMVSLKVNPTHAADLADLIIAADYRGHYSHGLNRLEMYVNEILDKVTETDGEPAILKETPATAWVDGNNIVGPPAAKFCNNLAIKKAKEVGIGMVVCKGSNHFGIAGYYAIKAQEQGLLGMAFTNTSPCIVPTRAKQMVMGTNPISLAASGTEGDSFVLDMATSTVAFGKVELANRKGDPIPSGWACDADGKETHNPKDVLKETGIGGGLLPLGGVEESGGYKGYGLSVMVEVLCGILGGAAYAYNVRDWRKAPRTSNLGQCFIAINPESFAPGFEVRMQDLMDHCRNLLPMDPENPVLIAGDPERKNMADCDRRGGIPYHPNQLAKARETAQKLGVDPPKTNIKL